MESLALVASFIVLWLLLAGPVSLLCVLENCRNTGAVIGCLSIASGLLYLFQLPSFPVIVGLWAILTGVYPVFYRWRYGAGDGYA